MFGEVVGTAATKQILDAIIANRTPGIEIRFKKPILQWIKESCEKGQVQKHNQELRIIPHRMSDGNKLDDEDEEKV